MTKTKSRMMLVLGFVLVASVGSAKEPDPEEGKYYRYGELGVKNTEVVGSKLKLTFKPKAENAYWCPGITVQETKEAVVVTFVRGETYKSSAVDVDAKIGKHLIRTITIDTRGKDTYVKNGPKQYKKIHTAPQKASFKKSAAKKSKQVQTTTAGKVSRPPTRGWIVNKTLQPNGTKR